MVQSVSHLQRGAIVGHEPEEETFVEAHQVVDTPQPLAGGGYAERLGVSAEMIRGHFERRMQANVRRNGDDPCVKTECEPLPNKSTLFVRGAGDPDEVALNDIKQGVIGDCYLMAALGAIAQRHPALIKQMITEVRDGTGKVTAYKVAFYQGKSPGQYRRVEVTVDAREFPKNGAHAQVTGDRTADGADEIWPLIIEKAYAKLRGGYDVIGRGDDPGKAMSELLGTSHRNIVGSDVGKYSFADLKRDFGQRLVVLGTPDAPKGSELYRRLRKWNLYGGARLRGNQGFRGGRHKVRPPVQPLGRQSSETTPLRGSQKFVLCGEHRQSAGWSTMKGG